MLKAAAIATVLATTAVGVARGHNRLQDLPGTYEGSVPLIIDVKLTIDNNSSAADLDINVKVAHEEVTCEAEIIAFEKSTGTITFPNTTNIGDCMGDALRQQGKDPSKYFLKQNSDEESLTFHSAYPELKLKRVSDVDVAVSTCPAGCDNNPEDCIKVGCKPDGCVGRGTRCISA